MTTKNATPAQRILAALDETAEVENYSASEIEQLPMDVVEQRLNELGVDRTVPRFIRDLQCGGATPAQKLIDALSKDEEAGDEIEHLPLDEVTARLNDDGLNHAAGLKRLWKLVGTAEASAKIVVPFVRAQPRAAIKAWGIAAAAAVAAVICITEVHIVSLHKENVALKEQLKQSYMVASAKVVPGTGLPEPPTALDFTSGGGPDSHRTVSNGDAYATLGVGNLWQEPTNGQQTPADIHRPQTGCVDR